MTCCISASLVDRVRCSYLLSLCDGCALLNADAVVGSPLLPACFPACLMLLCFFYNAGSPW